MKKTICILTCLVLCLLFTSCNDLNGEISMEKFEEQVGIYKNKIENIDATLKINESIRICQDGDHIVMYSIETPTRACFGIRLTVISPKKSELCIQFDDANEYWTTDNINLFTSFISAFTNYGLQFDQTKTAVDSMLKSNHFRFNRKAYLSWNDYHSILYYTETF